MKEPICILIFCFHEDNFDLFENFATKFKVIALKNSGVNKFI